MTTIANKSMTNFVNNISQPVRGYLDLNTSDVIAHNYKENFTLKENIPDSLVESVVGYMTGFKLFGNAQAAFSIPIRGALISNELNNAIKLLKNIIDLDDASILAACRLTRYETAYQLGERVPLDREPSYTTIDNIRRMVARATKLFRIRHPLIGYADFTGGYTYNIQSNSLHFIEYDGIDGDILYKVSTSSEPPSPEETLALLTSFFLFKNAHNGYNVKFIAIRNVRLNKTFTFDVKNINKSNYRAVARLAGVPLEEEILLVNINFNGSRVPEEIKKYAHANISGFDSLTTAIANKDINPRPLYYNFVIVHNQKVVGNGNDAKQINDHTWVINGSEYYRDDAFLTTLCKKGFTDYDIGEYLEEYNRYKRNALDYKA